MTYIPIYPNKKTNKKDKKISPCIADNRLFYFCFLSYKSSSQPNHILHWLNVLHTLATWQQKFTKPSHKTVFNGGRMPEPYDKLFTTWGILSMKTTKNVFELIILAKSTKQPQNVNSHLEIPIYIFTGKNLWCASNQVFNAHNHV